VVIDNLNALGMTGCPNKAYAPLAVNTYAVLALAITLEGFELVAGRHAQKLQGW